MNPVYAWAKAFVGAATAGLTAAGTALTDGHITGSEWIVIALAVLGTFGTVGLVTNGPTLEQKALSEDVADLKKTQAAVNVAMENAPVLANGVAGYGNDALLLGTPIPVPTSPPPVDPPAEEEVETKARRKPTAK